MDGAAMHADPRGQCPRVGIEAAKGGQQRRMDVEQPILPAQDELRRQDAHEPGEADQLDVVGA
jgi:hypothetical protein